MIINPNHSFFFRTWVDRTRFDLSGGITTPAPRWATANSALSIWSSLLLHQIWSDLDLIWSNLDLIWSDQILNLIWSDQILNLIWSDQILIWSDLIRSNLDLIWSDQILNLISSSLLLHQGLIFVVDCADRDRIDEARQELHRFHSISTIKKLKQSSIASSPRSVFYLHLLGSSTTGRCAMP